MGATAPGTLLRDGGVAVVGGRITAVGPTAAVRRTLPPNAREVELGRAVLLPGLVNAHAHLELSHVRAGDPPASFADWIVSLAGKSGRDQPGFADRLAAAARDGAAQSLRFGVTTVGDITAHPHITRPALRGGPLRVVSFGEALGLAGARARFETSLDRALETVDVSPTLSIGLSPHAPYTVEARNYARCVSVARERGVPLATHLAETPDETAFLREHAGPFRDIWERLRTWDDTVERFDGSPIELAETVGLLAMPSAVLAHVNHCTDADLERLARGRAGVVYCPRTHAYFGHHPPHRWREMLQRGIHVAVGTDSCASSPDLNLVDDLRLLWRRHGHAVEASLLWALATTNAARILGVHDRAGEIRVGCAADLCAFPLLSDVDPLAAVLDSPTAAPVGVWVAGDPV